MAINNEITLVKFLKIYYNIPGGKVKFLRHKEVKYLLPEVKVIIEYDNEFLNQKVATGKYLKVKDCEGVIMYYRNPIYQDDKTVFENKNEFIEAPLYHRFKQYEDENYEEEIYGYNGPLSGVPRLSNDEIEQMEKWELLQLKSTLEKYNKMTMGAYYVLISKIKEELVRRRNETIDEKRAYQKKKENEKYY